MQKEAEGKIFDLDFFDLRCECDLRFGGHEFWRNDPYRIDQAVYPGEFLKESIGQ